MQPYSPRRTAPSFLSHRVFRAVNPSHPKYRTAAVKVVSLLRNPPPDRKALQKEVQIHAILKHPHILKFLGVEERGVSKEERGRYLPAVYIVLELAGGGDLFDKITPDAGVETDLAHFYFTQLIAGLEYVHGQGIAHRDIKPENMLLDNEGNLKIADFGLCSVYKHRGREREMKGACGSLPYIAPEMNGRPYKGEPVDVWSAGVVLFALLVGNTPWDEPTTRAPEYVAYLDGTLLEYEPWNRIPGEELALLKAMLNPDPSRRLSIAAIKRHRWFTRKNPLLAPVSGQCTDPTSLAERLLQGLIVNGEMDYAAPLSVEERAKQLHSDGERADVPENISFTQPEVVPARSLHDLPPSSALQPHRRGGPPSSLSPSAAPRRSGYLDSLSQQFAARRTEFAQSQTQALGAHGGAPPSASQFTEALNFFTQPSLSQALGGPGGAPSAMSMTPNLTRFSSHASVPVLLARLSAVLHSMRVQHVVEPLGDALRPGEDLPSNGSAAPADATHGDADADAVPDMGGDMDTEMDVDLDVDVEGRGATRTHSTASAASRTSGSGSDSDGGTVVLDEKNGSAKGTTTAAGSTSTSASRARPAVGAHTNIPYGTKGARIRLGLIDRRKCPLRGEIRIEALRRAGGGVASGETAEEGEHSQREAQCLVLMRRSRGNPLEWRRVFGQIVREGPVADCICR